MPNPTAGCDEVEELYTDYEEVFTANTGAFDEYAYVGRYKSLCAQSQQEAEQGTETEEDVAGAIIGGCLADPKSEELSQFLEGADRGPASPRQGSPIFRRPEGISGEEAREAFSELGGPDFTKINDLLGQYRTKCSSLTTSSDFCTFLSGNISEAEVNQENYDNLKRHLKGLNNFTEKPPISDDANFPLPSEEEERLMEAAERRLGRVFAVDEENVCNKLALDAVTAAVEHCLGDDRAASCFRTELEEIRRTGTPASKSLAALSLIPPDQSLSDGLGQQPVESVYCEGLNGSDREEEGASQESSNPLDDIFGTDEGR